VFGTRAVTDVQRLAFAAEDYHNRHGHWPGPADLRTVDPDLPAHDPWRQPFRFDTDAASLVVRSAGLDAVLDTPDDVLSDRIGVRR
jgi:hypothetical protein